MSLQVARGVRGAVAVDKSEKSRDSRVGQTDARVDEKGECCLCGFEWLGPRVGRVSCCAVWGRRHYRVWVLFDKDAFAALSTRLTLGRLCQSL